ncbi:GTP cyclohydrolase II [Scedosporium apiospermum]|uniref:GTP cyclohydrolase II n=1 Tax=Pseudallescheria apiosperma TaxID=563466 RepID=A0A084GCR7_PSEDA|nr:GTP cyclohydrolase II [Scedosporium apiospermum]KEZ45129.1 GTP cyclohydrolase II [Scedosporium apiospermum]
MPAQSSTESSGASKEWPQSNSTAELPSFYSPPSKPTEETTTDNSKANDTTKVISNSNEPNQILSPIPTYDRISLDTPAPSSTTTPGSVPPPPSLLSPSFTPPATPGTPAADGAPRLKSVPVDSTIPSGGCGAKRPRLLETLPNVECIVRARIPTVSGSEMFLHLYTNDVDNKEHLAIVFGPHIRSHSLDAPRPGETEMDRMIRGAYVGKLYPGRTSSRQTDEASSSSTPAGDPPASAGSSTGFGTPLVRIHSECYTGETAWSARCDCGEQLDEAARLMGHPDNTSGGIIIYLRQEGRGIGLGEKLKAYNLQDLGSDTVEANLLLRHPADARSYGLATAILRDLDQKEIRLLTNNPDKIRAVEGPNREVVVTERVAMVPLSWRGQKGIRSTEVQAYLETKIKKMGHMLDF